MTKFLIQIIQVTGTEQQVDYLKFTSTMSPSCFLKHVIISLHSHHKHILPTHICDGLATVGTFLDFSNVEVLPTQRHHKPITKAPAKQCL